MKLLTFLASFLILMEVNGQQATNYMTNSSVSVSEAPVFNSGSQSQSNLLNIDCFENHFWSVETGGAINEWAINNGAITFVGTIFNTSPINSIAFSDTLNNATIPSTFYGSYGNLIYYYDGTNWISNIPNVTNVINNGGYKNYMYYVNYSSPEKIYRFNGSVLTLVYSCAIGREFCIADLAIDQQGNIWTFTGTNSQYCDSLIQISPNGTTLHSYSFAHDMNNAYGSFMSRDTLYVGIGPQNAINPNTLLAICKGGSNAFVQQVIPFPNSNFYDLASCMPGKYIPTSTTELNDEEQISVYPNPFSESVTLSLKENISFPLNINITDCLGKSVFDGEIYSGELDLSTLSSGIYYLTIPGKSIHVKLLKSGY